MRVTFLIELPAVDEVGISFRTGGFLVSSDDRTGRGCPLKSNRLLANTLEDVRRKVESTFVRLDSTIWYAWLGEGMLDDRDHVRARRTRCVKRADPPQAAPFLTRCACWIAGEVADREESVVYDAVRPGRIVLTPVRTDRDVLPPWLVKWRTRATITLNGAG